MATPAEINEIKIGAQLTNLVQNGGTPPTGWREYTNDQIKGTLNSGSGYQAKVYVNDTTKEIYIANAGTNDFKDVKGWPTVITGGNSPQFKDALNVGKEIQLQTISGEFKGYTVTTSGYSWGEGMAQIQANTFGWKGVGFDGVGAGSIVSSSGFQALAAGLGITPVGKASDFISCNTAGLGLFGGGVVGSLGADIAGTRSCTVELPSSTESGVLNALLTFSANTPAGFVANYALGKLATGVAQHDIKNISDAVQAGNFKLGDSAGAAPTYKPFSFTDDDGNILRTKQDANGAVVLGSDGKPLYELILNDAVQRQTTTVLLTGSGVFQESLQKTDTNGDGIFDKAVKTTQASNRVTEVKTDTNNDGKWDTDSLTLGTVSYNLLDVAQRTTVESDLRNLYNSGNLSNNFWNDFTSQTTTMLVGGLGLNPNSSGLGLQLSPSIYNPIGAFYESKSASLDTATSIANKTFRVLNSVGVGMTAAQLAALDTNADGKLSGTELNGLYAWSDLNEDGVNQTGELTTLSTALSSVRSSDYAFYTSGNANYKTTAQQSAQAPANSLLAPIALASSYSTLRNTDNRFYINAYMWIDWSASMVKISSNQQNMVGTEGNDNFDINYYAQYNGVYFNLGLVQNFYAGGGNDVMGGSSRNDNLWGGTGNDVLFGYEGDDKLYGEDGNDELQGGAGNDTLDGGTGDDKLFGQVGNDVMNGGDGNDIMMGFTASNDAKQTLNAGETDNDTMFGGAGNDQMYGGLGDDTMDGGIGNDLVDGGAGNDTLFGNAGDDELSGGAGNDVMDGGVGADKMFGGVGNDQMWGGDGNDIMMGFTASNEAKQTLAAGETDDDLMYGGAGDDLMIGGLGNDQLWGGVGNDELQGGDGNDVLYGESGNDRLFGGAGDDILYGGDGDDLIVGGVANNEAALAAGVSDNNFLYGGAGNDTLIGGVGNDYIDGGAGADNMQGGKGDDTYVVNSVNDVILEQAGEGYDTVISSANYILNANIEELRLVEGFNINGTGNSMNNKIIGNSQDNILDGVTGADVMIGGLGNDTYYVDNTGDQVVELAGEGTDTVNSSISYTLGANVENLTLLDFSKAEKGIADGVNILVYGYPKAFELDYMQGNAVAGYKGTCALTSIANLATQANQALSEAQVVQKAIDNNWCVNSSTANDYQRGGSNYVQQQALLNSYGIHNGVILGYNEQSIANLIKGGRGVILAVNAGKLWGDSAYVDNGGVNHVVTVTGVACDATTGAINGFYIADSGRGLVSDMTRYISIADFRNDANVANAYAIYTIDPIKLWEEDLNATGNELANVITGNRGDNLLTGGKGNDTLIGQAGNDTYVFGKGDGQDIVIESDATVGNTDVLKLNDINQTNLWFKHVGNDLQINVMGTSDQIVVKDWYVGGSSGADNHIERIKTADGLTMYDTDVEKFVQAMAAFAPPSATQTSWTSGQTSNGQVLLTVTH